MKVVKIIKILGIEGKKIDIIPKVSKVNLTEVYNKKFEFLGYIIYDKRWKKYVWSDQPGDIQMSKDCLIEAFEMTEKYWSNKNG